MKAARDEEKTQKTFKINLTSLNDYLLSVHPNQNGKE